MKSIRTRLSWDVERPVLGIVAFEASRLMSKVVHMWHCLSDEQMRKLREDVANSIGIQKLVSNDADYLMNLALAEIIDTFVCVAKSVSMLGKKCIDPIYQNLDGILDDPSEVNPKWYEWQYRLKKMEKKVKKMRNFVATTEQLYSELEVLSELEQRLKQFEAGAKPGKARLLEFQHKVECQHQEVKNLQEKSPWVRAYDYIVRLLFRSLSTIMARIRYVNGVSPNEDLCRSGHHDNNSIEAASVSLCPGFSISLSRSLSNMGSGADNSKLKYTKFHDHSLSYAFHTKQNQMKVSRFPTLSVNGCVTGGIGFPVIDSYTPSCGGSFSFRSNGDIKDLCLSQIMLRNGLAAKASFVDSKRRLLSAPPSTLGHAAWALHYANLIISIEKLAASPHSIILDARNDLFCMLTTSIRAGLRAKLKTFPRSTRSRVYEAAIAEEWRLALARILQWISPLAYNMVQWHSERIFDRQRLVSGSSVLLVQTLYFANQIETEAAIVELLIGLNYIARFRRQINEKPIRVSL